MLALLHMTVPPFLATAWASQIALWSLSHVSVLDMLPSLTDRGGPLRRCASTLIRSHLRTSSPAGNPGPVSSGGWKQPARPNTAWRFALFRSVSISISLRVLALEEIKSAILSFHLCTAAGSLRVWLVRMLLDARVTSASLWQLAYGTTLPPPAWVYASDLCHLGCAPEKQVSAAN